MKRYSDRKIVVVKRATNLDHIINRFNTVQQAEFYISSIGGDFGDYLDEHEVYTKCINEILQKLDTVGNVQLIDRDFVPNYMFGDDDIVFVAGQDGMVANTMKYLDGQPLIGINPDRNRWDGILLPFDSTEVDQVAISVIEQKHKFEEVTMAEVTLNDGQSLYAVNDFYIGTKSHVSSRYSLSFEGTTEYQSSSGIIVSTGMGSTGWMKSVLAGAQGVISYLTNKSVDVSASLAMEWNSESLIYSVREPFPSRKSKTNLTFGKITNQHKLSVQSHMPENGVIFSDGIENDYLEFSAGSIATIGIADKKGYLVK